MSTALFQSQMIFKSAWLNPFIKMFKLTPIRKSLLHSCTHAGITESLFVLVKKFSTCLKPQNQMHVFFQHVVAKITWNAKNGKVPKSTTKCTGETKRRPSLCWVDHVSFGSVRFSLLMPADPDPVDHKRLSCIPVQLSICTVFHMLQQTIHAVCSR